MKAQRRHDLKQNVLDTELAKGADYLKRHLNLIGGAALLAALIALAWVGISRYRVSNRDAAQAQFDKAMLGGEQSRDALQRLADGAGPEAAIASRKLADDYADQMLMGEGRLAPGQINDLAAKAKSCYNRVIENFKDQNIQVANAHFGLAKLAESQGDLETARKEYEIVTNPRNDGLPVLAMAKAAADRLPDPSQPDKADALDMNVYLAAGPAAPEPDEFPASAPATGPSTKPAGKDASTTKPAAGQTTMPAGIH
jgi:tetratricopeptide (TPR) repeat protein